MPRCRSVGTHPNRDGATLATLLGGEGVRETEAGAPVASSHGNDAKLGDDDGGPDGSCDFLGRLDAETDVAFGIANDDNGLESSPLTGTGLLLHRLDL